MNSDPIKITQIVSNLCSNALKFTDEGHIIVDIQVLRRTNDQLCVTVSDSGIGIDSKQLATIFSEFSQADDSISRKYGGTGLGLSICQRLSVLLGGNISVESAVGQGAKFTVTVPINVIVEADIIPPSDHKASLAIYPSIPNIDHYIIDDLAHMDYYDENSDVALYFHHSLNDEIMHLKSRFSGPKFVISDWQNCMESKGDIHYLAKPYTSRDVLMALTALETSTSPTAQQGSNQPIDALTLNVLIVEDIKVNQFIAEQTLNRLNTTHHTVNNGQECLDSLQESDYQVILLDIQMPVMDGITAIKQIKSRHLAPSTIIVALTANTFSEDIAYYYDVGFDDVLSKPFKLEQMKHLLNKYRPAPVLSLGHIFMQ